MSERTSYEPGVPSWADLTSPDVEASKRFYSGLFGWDAQDAGPAEETGGYAMFTLRGRNVAGLSPVQDENQPPIWSVYVATDDGEKKKLWVVSPNPWADPVVGEVRSW